MDLTETNLDAIFIKSSSHSTKLNDIHLAYLREICSDLVTDLQQDNKIIAG